LHLSILPWVSLRNTKDSIRMRLNLNDFFLRKKSTYKRVEFSKGAL
jgi:hypothetical protein